MPRRRRPNDLIDRLAASSTKKINEHGRDAPRLSAPDRWHTLTNEGFDDQTVIEAMALGGDQTILEIQTRLDPIPRRSLGEISVRLLSSFGRIGPTCPATLSATARPTQAVR